MGSFVYKNEDARNKMFAFYDKAMEELGITYSEEYVPTSFGNTHIIIAGEDKGDTIITLHGGNGITPLNLKLFMPLLKKYKVIAPDVPGMPGKSEPYRRISSKKDEYCAWLEELMEYLNISRAKFVVSSYSSAMLLSLAAFKPERIDKAALVVPSGLAHGPLFNIIKKMSLPFLTYYLHPSQKGLSSILDIMMDEPDEIWKEFMDLMMSTYKMEMRAPKEYTKQDLENFLAPVILFASPEDVFFPYDQVSAAAKEIFQGRQEIFKIQGKHLPSTRTLQYICSKIEEFF